MRMSSHRARGLGHTLSAQVRNVRVRGNLPCDVEPRRRNRGRGGLRWITDDEWLANARARCLRPDRFCPLRKHRRQQVDATWPAGHARFRISCFLATSILGATNSDRRGQGCSGVGSRGAIRPLILPGGWGLPKGNAAACRRRLAQLPSSAEVRVERRPPWERWGPIDGLGIDDG